MGKQKNVLTTTHARPRPARTPTDRPTSHTSPSPPTHARDRTRAKFSPLSRAHAAPTQRSGYRGLQRSDPLTRKACAGAWGPAALCTAAVTGLSDVIIIFPWPLPLPLQQADPLRDRRSRGYTAVVVLERASPYRPLNT